jgi:multidrug efflux pump subunit AcrA (membrane-fusion protein)
MTAPGFRLRHLAFLGPNRRPALVAFAQGLNIIYGASDTGKSFVVEAIDFMLGGARPLRDIPQRVGYDRILLGIETIAGEQFTLSRSADGGRFLVYPGLHQEIPPPDVSGRELADQHSEKGADNLSAFLLEKCNLSAKRVRKNKAGVTNSLSFRNLARLLIVTETEITAQRSPLSDGNPTADTPNFATFKLLLTGVDDSAVVARKPDSAEELSRDAQLNLLDELADDYRQRIRDIAKQPKELDDQLTRLESTLSQHTNQLAATEAQYREASTKRRDLRNRLEEARDRRAEIGSLLERFELLAKHYASDIARLRAIEEAGTLFNVLGQAPCPLCGAAPEHHNRESDCDGNTDAVVAAARAEIAKIEILQRELVDTIDGLNKEGHSFDRRIPRIERDLETVASNIDQMIAPSLSRIRASYADLADKRGEVREALAIFRSLEDIERRRKDLASASDDEKGSTVSDGDLPTSIADAFAQKVEVILKEWHFPDANRVQFDPKTRDLIIAGKQRTARGKGLRAITHAAFTLGILEYCRTNNVAHPGFVILDSPLLAYRAPEGDDADVAGTDLNEQFYSTLGTIPSDRQVIIVENTTPPQSIASRPNVEFFSGNPHTGRYGFFPIAQNSPPSNEVVGNRPDAGT